MRSRVVFLVLLLAVGVASTLGLVHGTLHVPGETQREARTHAHEGAPVSARVRTRHRHAWLHALFVDHNDAQCHLYDQLVHGSAAPSVPWTTWPVLPPDADFAWFESAVRARWIVRFHARAPPSTR